MAAETAGVERALGAIGTTFRLMRLYPPTHPAVVEALKQIGEALPGLAALGTVEWKVGVTGLPWHGPHPLPRNTLMAGKRASAAFRPDVLPVDVEVKRAVTALGNAATPEEQAAAVEKLAALAPQLLGLHDVAIVADAIAALDRLLPTANDPKVVQAIDQAAVALSERGLVERLVHRLGEARVPPEEREAVVTAVAALASLSMGPVLDAFIAAPVDLRAPYRGAVRKAADRALEPLQGKLVDPDAQVVAAAAEFVGLTGSPQAVALLIPLLRHASEFVREAALLGLAEAGGREIARPAMPALKDESVAVRAAAVRAVAAAGDPTSSTVLVRRVEQEADEGVQAELLRAIGRLGARDALDVLARYAEPGGMMHPRGATVRGAAGGRVPRIPRPEARGLLEIYSHDQEPAVRKAAEAGLK